MKATGVPAPRLCLVGAVCAITYVCGLGAASVQARPAEPADPEDPAASEGRSGAEDAAKRPRPDAARAPAPSESPSYGLALRARYLSVPSWSLRLFATHSVPLSTFGHFGFEFFRRRGTTDLVAAFSYQNMSPPDGNWLAVGHNAATDTNFVQYKGLAIYNFDVAFISRDTFNEWVGIHYGAGLGIGIVGGDIVRTVYGCRASDFGQCRPPPVLNTRRESSVPPVVPIVNVVAGVDFRVPTIERWEAKIEIGFFDAFFVGLGVVYQL